MKRIEFLQNIFTFYRVHDESGTLLRAYELALTTKYTVDWDKLYEKIIKTAETRTLPVPKYFVDMLPSYKKIEPSKEGLYSGCTVRVNFYGGRWLDFTVVDSDCKTSVGSIIRDFEKIDETGRKYSEIKTIVRYPKEAVLLGDKVFWNINVPNSDKMTDLEREVAESKIQRGLERQIKTIWRSEV